MSNAPTIIPCPETIACPGNEPGAESTSGAVALLVVLLEERKSGCKTRIGYDAYRLWCLGAMSNEAVAVVAGFE